MKQDIFVWGGGVGGGKLLPLQIIFACHARVLRIDKKYLQTFAVPPPIFYLSEQIQDEAVPGSLLLPSTLT
jgi:hypothetical protein